LDDKGSIGAVIAVIYGVRISKSSLGASQNHANTCSRVARFVKKSSRILPRVWLILFGVWKPIKRENSEFSLACSQNTAQKKQVSFLFFLFLFDTQL
jgi:hypothetical protein